MNRRTVLYISGPYTGDVDANIARAEAAAIDLWSRGFAVICPHANTNNFERKGCTASYEDYIEGDLAILRGADAIVLLEGWEQSRGATREKVRADSLGIPVYFYPDVNLPTRTEEESILQEAERLTNGPRQRAYGHPLDDFTKTVMMINGYLLGRFLPGKELRPEEWPDLMVLSKLSRESNMPKRDNRTDVAGYVNTKQLTLEEQERRALLHHK